jgi:CheY-like chemotaxis protein
VTGRLILVVDDDDDIRESIVEILVDHDYATAEARHGEDALQQLRGGLRPDAILLDLMMPVLDGRAFRDAQRADPVLAGIPVVVLSAHSDVAVTAADMKPCAFLKKPSSLKEVLAAVDGCFVGEPA